MAAASNRFGDGSLSVHRPGVAGAPSSSALGDDRDGRTRRRHANPRNYQARTDAAAARRSCRSGRCGSRSRPSRDHSARRESERQCGDARRSLEDHRGGPEAARHQFAAALAPAAHDAGHVVGGSARSKCLVSHLNVIAERLEAFLGLGKHTEVGRTFGLHRHRPPLVCLIGLKNDARRGDAVIRDESGVDSRELLGGDAGDRLVLYAWRLRMDRHRSESEKKESNESNQRTVVHSTLPKGLWEELPKEAPRVEP